MKCQYHTGRQECTAVPVEGRYETRLEYFAGKQKIPYLRERSHHKTLLDGACTMNANRWAPLQMEIFHLGLSCWL